MSDTFDRESLRALYAAVSACDGVSVSELRSLLNEFSEREIAAADLQAYREGREPWKKLHDEVVPTARFLSSNYPDDTRVRFALSDKAPDAWVQVGTGEWVGIEVTGALARAGVEVARTLAKGTVVPGFIALPDDAPQKSFDRAKTRGRVMNSREAVDEAIDHALAAGMARKDKEKFAGQILLIVAPIGSSPDRSEDDLRDSHAERAKSLPFAEVFVLGRGERTPIVRLK